MANGRSEKGVHGAAVATVNNDDSYNNNGVVSVRHQDPPQAAQFKNGGHEWEGGRTPHKKAQGGEASPISRPDHERAHAVADAGINAMDEDDSGNEDDALGDDDDDDANEGANNADDNADDDDDANDIASVERQTQRGRRSNPADRASGWRRATTPTKMLTKRRCSATARTINNDGPGGRKMTNDESASGGRGREPNHDRTVGTAIARTRTVLAGVQDFCQEPIALATLAVLNTPRQATKACWLPKRGPATAGTPTRRAMP